MGGFYNNFESKEDLIAKACDKVGVKSLQRWKEHIDNPDIADPLKRIGSSYLSPKNRDDLASTCIFSTLGAEVPRHDPIVQQVFAQGVESTIELLSTLVEGQSRREAKKCHSHVLAMVGRAHLIKSGIGQPDIRRNSCRGKKSVSPEVIKGMAYEVHHTRQKIRPTSRN